jgi:fermentation-respiration switch protein FrsA (DUF1100 family)
LEPETGKLSETTPFEMGKTLFDACKDPKYFYPIKGAGHNDTSIVGGENYYKTLKDFAFNSRL